MPSAIKAAAAAGKISPRSPRSPRTRRASAPSAASSSGVAEFGENDDDWESPFRGSFTRKPTWATGWYSKMNKAIDGDSEDPSSASNVEERQMYATFHEHGSFYGVWLLVILVGVHTLAAMRSILEPLLWAFFIMMAVLPFTDFMEHFLLGICAATASCFRCGKFARPRKTVGFAVAEGPETRSAAPAKESVTSSQNSSDSGSSDAEVPGGILNSGGCCKDGCKEGCGCARMISVFLTLGFIVGSNVGFFMIIYQSALHMQRDWEHYQYGAERIEKQLLALKDFLPETVLQNTAHKGLSALEEVVNFLLGSLVEHFTALMVEILMMLLYMVFWLCEPIHIGENVPLLFKQYIMLKSLASALYALCIWLLLVLIGVDLAIVFGLITFCFNFVPEIGPFFAILLPMPVILFDGRLENPLLKMGFAMVGQLGLKFIFANIVEVKLVERQDDMKMHPVMILFFVAFFGWIWGATGMLLSVPIMATLKAVVGTFPASYRDTFLIVLEGDKHAPARFVRRRAQSLR